MVRLNAQGWTVPVIAEIFECHQQTVRATLRRWEQDGLGGLWEASGRGAKRKWQEADLQSVGQWVEQDLRTYNSPQLAEKLAKERQVKLSARRCQTGRLTVIVQDNGSLHTSQLTRQQWQRWQEQGLFLFFLPRYCSEMNRIEAEVCRENNSSGHLP